MKFVTIDDDGTNVADVEERKEKRGISLNLGSGLEGYSYLGPSHSRGLNRQYTPITEYGYDGVNYGAGSSFVGGGYQGAYQGYNTPYGSYPYRSGAYPGAYSYQQRPYTLPINTYPLGGIGTVGPYGAGAYGGFNGNNRFGGADRFGGGGDAYGFGFQQQGFQ